MVKVRGLQTAVGEYGILRRGKIVEVRSHLAVQLAKEGIAEIISGEDGKEPSNEIRGGVRITDTSGNIQDTADGQITKAETIIKPGETSKANPEEVKKAEPVETEKETPAETKKAEPKETSKATK